MINIFGGIAGIAGIGIVGFILFWALHHKGAFFHGGRLLDRFGKSRGGLEDDEFRLETDLEHINKDLKKKQRFEKKLEKKELNEDKKQIHLCNIIVMLLEAQKKIVEAYRRHGYGSEEEALKERREFNESRTEFYNRMRELRQSLVQEADLLLREIAVEAEEAEEVKKEERIEEKEEALEKKEAAEEKGAAKKELNEEIITGKIEDLDKLEHSKLNHLIVINKRWLQYIRMLLSDRDKSYFIRMIGFQRVNQFVPAEQDAHYLMYYLQQKRKDVLTKRGITWSKKKIIGTVGVFSKLWKKKAAA
ncbi:hypothetical protein KY343_07075 [Candidatus Woesearchaeota archaeon]|nr:hypothetical protein [Candidatus Woesearchaeota archaeon]